VNKAELYRDCCLISEIDEYLSKYGFKRVITRWTPHNWGDALYENQNLVNPRKFGHLYLAIALYSPWGFSSLIMQIKVLAKKLFK
jgi:hypothetical protein